MTRRDRAALPAQGQAWPTGKTVGMEALPRWQHPRRGLLAAAEFVGLAEQSYLMRELTE